MMFHSEASYGGVAGGPSLAEEVRARLASRSAQMGRAVQRLTRDFWRGGFTGLVGMVARGGGLALRYRAHRRLLRVIAGGTTSEILRLHPRIAYRHSTTYLFEGATWRQRLAMLEAHYAFLNATHDAAFFNATLRRNGLEVWRDTLEGHRLSIALLGPCLHSRHREGELTLGFAINGDVIYKIAFSVASTASITQAAGGSAWATGHVLYIGQVQGTAGGLSLLREASKSCCGNAPRDLLMSALAGLAAAWGIQQVLGVQGTRQLSGPGSPEAPRGFDYDAFWEQYEGKLNADGHYVMQLPFHEGPILGSSSAHRRRTRMKRRFKADLSDAVAAEVGRHRRTEPPARGTAAAAPCHAPADFALARSMPAT